ncbi:MAG TPA: 1-acyl-sn-glycerol-3-phosphate acyltransferase [Gemmatimonadaceae bacterium]|nr:1-acyl-sn-glycerol-3-phosphate acyltransferase [Gemmatimonadaceae bacterium]
MDPIPSFIRKRLNRSALRSVRKRGARLDRFKLTGKSRIRATLLEDRAIAAAVSRHARDNQLDESAVWKRVDDYIDEIVPFFNILAYYRLGYFVSRGLLSALYKVSADQHAALGASSLPKDAIVVYLMNHRSNADYVLVGYVLTGKVAISYAVGEWARAFPLEYIFKSFGSYFVRRKFREPLYHTVLERYVQLITRNGVTQGIFPEGGLTRDGKLRPAKIGLLDYILGVARDDGYRDRIYLVPVAINYDRVLEDRSLLRELAVTRGERTPPRMAQLYEVSRYLWWNAARAVTRRWKRYGRAAVTIGEPVALAGWFTETAETGESLFELPRHERLARVQSLCDDMMARIGAIIPVTPVPLACAAIQSLDSDFIPRTRLIDRMAEMRDVLLELNARVIRSEGTIEETFDRAWKMLRMRRMLVHSGDGYAVLPGNRPLISYYANSIAHLLGPFEEGIRKRDTLAAMKGAWIS